MSEVFWIARGELQDIARISSQAAGKGGKNPAWMQVIHWIGDTRPAPHFENSLHFSWPSQYGLAAYLLQDACRMIKAHEYNLVMLVEKIPTALDQVLLASPQAVGHYNLMPRATLPSWWTVPHEGLASLPQLLEKSGYDPGTVCCVEGEPELAGQVAALFKSACSCTVAATGTIGKLNELVASLVERRSGLGLLVTQAPHQPVLVTLVEP